MGYYAGTNLVIRIGIALGLLFPTFLWIGVDAGMASELVRARKPLFAAGVSALVGFFARVGADMPSLRQSAAFHRCKILLTWCSRR